MFTNISWTNYLIAAILLLAIYYVLIAIRFYYHDLKNLAGKRKFSRRPAHNEPSEELGNMGNNSENEGVHIDPSQARNSFAGTPDNTFQETEHLIGRLKEAIEEAFHKKHTKQELSLCLKSVLKEYAEIMNSPFRSAIEELIVSECAKHGPIMLSGDEVVTLWDGA